MPAKLRYDPIVVLAGRGPGRYTANSSDLSDFSTNAEQRRRVQSQPAGGRERARNVSEGLRADHGSVPTAGETTRWHHKQPKEQSARRTASQ